MYCGWNIDVSFVPLRKSNPGRDVQHVGPAPFPHDRAPWYGTHGVVHMRPVTFPMLWYTVRAYTARWRCNLDVLLVGCGCVRCVFVVRLAKETR